MIPLSAAKELRCPPCKKLFATVRPDGTIEVVERKVVTQVIEGARVYRAWCTKCLEYRRFPLQ